MNAEWIWIANDGALPESNVYAIFRTRFRGGPNTVLRVSVAGNYVARVNGKVSAFGQYTDFPHAKTWTDTDISHVCTGDDELEVEVHYSGDAFTSHFNGKPGLCAEILRGGAIIASSDETWDARPDTRYDFGERPAVSGSLDYTFHFDSTRTLPPFRKAVAAKRETALSPRPVEPPSDLGFVAGAVLRTGVFCRPDAAPPLGPRFAADVLDSDPPDGLYAIYDLGEERAGFVEVEVDAPRGTVFEIAHGEYLADGHLPKIVVGPNVTTAGVDVFVASGGRETFTHWLRRLGARYLEIHAIGDPAAISIHAAGLRVVGLDGMDTPPFSCDDRFFEKANEISARTLRLCLHEKYENCPWREQSICAYDARNQQLFGYCLWGNYARAAAMIRLFAQAQRGNGFLQAATPTARRLWIPMFTFAWMSSIHEYVLHSGDLSIWRELGQLVDGMLSKILSHRCGDLYMPPDDEGVWNYCESANLEYCANPPNAFYNLYLREALLGIAALHGMCGDAGRGAAYSAEARRIGETATERFWDERAGAYFDSRNPETGLPEFHYSHIQSLFLAQGLVSPLKARSVMRGIEDGSLRFQSLASLPYLIEGFLRYGSHDDLEWLHAKIKALYSPVMECGDTTWWEDALGRQYGGGRGSLCHGWSATPALYQTRMILGVKPISPGFATFLCDPIPLGSMREAEGSVPTPHGPIMVSWRLGPGGLEKNVSAPPECKLVTES